MLDSFAGLARKYEAIFFDAYGVLKNSSGVIRGVPEVLERLVREGKHVYVITNDASKSLEEMARSYRNASGQSVVEARHIVSSGLLARDFLRAKVRTGRVAFLGGPASAGYVSDAGLQPVHIGHCSGQEQDIAAIAFLDDEGFDWFSGLNTVLNLIRTRRVPVVVANTDLAYPVSDDRLGIAVGSVALMIESIVGKRFTQFGKPGTLMFEHAFALAKSRRPNLSRGGILMVGDTLETDILGANTFGLDTALVLSGNTLAERAMLMIQTKGIIPTYLCDSVLT